MNSELEMTEAERTSYWQGAYERMAARNIELSRKSPGVAAIPLEWREPTDHPMDMQDSAIAVADGIGGKYHISGPELIDRNTGAQGYLLWFAADEFVWKAFETIDAAKAHAETDWQVQFALHLQPPTGERMDE